MIGFYGIFFELSSPGAILPGVIGGISLVLGLYSLHSLTINYAGLLLMLLGLIFFIAELKAPTHGLLAAGGIIALTLGSLMLVKSPLPYLRVSLKVILPSVAFTAAFFAFAVWMALRAQRRRPAVGRRSLIGTAGEACTDIAATGTVFAQGTHWQARSDEAIPAGSRIRIEGIEGLVLKVRRDGGDGKDDG
jgi:membrane-bound serine protease (ClpP class)